MKRDCTKVFLEKHIDLIKACALGDNFGISFKSHLMWMEGQY